MLRYFLLVLAFASQTASACPEVMDNSDGIRVTREQPFFSVVLRKTDAGLTEQRVMERGGSPEQVSSLYPHPLVAGRRVSASGTLSLQYSTSPTELDNLAETKTWASKVVLRSDEKIAGRGTLTVEMIGIETIRIGDCDYRVWHVSNRLLLNRRAPIRSEKFYSPALGINLRTITLTPDGHPKSEVAFDLIE